MATNGNSKLREHRAQKIIKAIQQSKGLLTLAAAKAGVTYSTVWRYARDFPSVKQAVEESKEGMLDLAEGKLFQAINSGNMTAIIFFLKTKGKERGYIERVEQEFAGRIEHKHEVVNFDNGDIRDALQALVECRAIAVGNNQN
jgi:hypothetical protein